MRQGNRDLLQLSHGLHCISNFHSTFRGVLYHLPGSNQLFRYQHPGIPRNRTVADPAVFRVTHDAFDLGGAKTGDLGAPSDGSSEGIRNRAGKIFSCLLVLAGMLILTLYFPLLLLIFGDPVIGPILTSYLGLFLLGSASVAIGIFASSLTPNQIVSAVVAGGILFGLWFLGMVGSLIPEPLGEILSYFSLSEHFPGFVRGVVDTRDLVYYLSVTAVFLFLSVRSIETERWR